MEEKKKVNATFNDMIIAILIMAVVHTHIIQVKPMAINMCTGDLTNYHFSIYICVYVCVYIYIYTYICVCVCVLYVCVLYMSVCVCVCVCVCK